MPARSLIYFAPVRYTSFWQRPHYMAEALLAGPIDRLLWVDPYPTRLPRLADFNRPSDVPQRPDTRIDGVDVLRPVALPIEPVRWGRALNRYLFLSPTRAAIENWLDGGPFAIGVGKPSPLAIDVIRSLGQRIECRGRFYDAMDRFTHFYAGLSSRAMQSWEDELLPLCDWVQASSTRLRDDLRHSVASVRLCLNGVQPQAIENARRYAAKRGPTEDRGPVFGYIGTLGTWFDWPWTIELARQLQRRTPNGRVVLVGPLFGGPKQPLPANVEIRRPVTHGEALSLAAGFDVGIVPFKDTPLTRCVDPLKYYEYRGLGLPVLATSFGELQFKSDPALLLAEPGTDLGRAVDRALALRPPVAAAPPLKDWSWSSRFAPLEAWLYSLGRPVQTGIGAGQTAVTAG